MANHMYTYFYFNTSICFMSKCYADHRLFESLLTKCSHYTRRDSDRVVSKQYHVFDTLCLFRDLEYGSLKSGWGNTAAI